MADSPDVLTVTNGDPAYRTGARLCNFPTGKTGMLQTHRTWLDDNVKGVIQSNPAPYVHLFGYASNLNRHHINQRKLSNDRLLDTKAYVAAYGANADFQQEIPMGAENDGANLNDDGYYRAVEIQVFAKRPPVKPTPLPPDPAPPPPDSCRASAVLGGLRQFLAKLTFLFPAALLALPFIRMPTFVRRLNGLEQDQARLIYGDSLDFSRIFITDAVGAQDRPVTVAFEAGGCGWVVALNLGDANSWHDRPRADTLIHELAHAWQSQHHGDKRAYMVNSINSQAMAFASEGATDAAYWYVPGKPFGDYGAEQIAYQAERFYAGGMPPAMKEAAVVTTIKAATPVYVISADNQVSLSRARFGVSGTPGLVK